jgi:GAF domain-containing protein
MKKLQQLLEKVIKLEGADMGNIQIYDPIANDLKIVVHFGFEESFLSHFSSVKPFDSSACGRAFGIGGTVMISDIETDIGFKVNEETAKKAGFRSVKSVPIFNKQDKCIGIISTHFNVPKQDWKTDELIHILPQIAALLESL